MDVEDKIPNYIKAIRSLNLTLAGKISLMIFPEEIIKNSDEIMCNVSKKVANPFAYFKSIANKQCEEDKIEISFYEASSLAREAGIDLRNSEKVDAQNPQNILVQQRNSSFNQAPKRGNSSLKPQGPVLSLEERNKRSEEVRPTIMRKFWGRPETLTEEERKTLLIQPEPQAYAKEISTANQYWNQTVDNGFSSDYCMKELNRMVELRHLPRGEMGKINNPAAAKFVETLSGDYMDGMIMNMSKQYMYALMREEKEKKDAENESSKTPL